MIAEVTIALCFGSFGCFKIMQAHEYGVKSMRVRVSASAFYVFASTSMFQFSEINFFWGVLQAENEMFR